MFRYESFSDLEESDSSAAALSPNATLIFGADSAIVKILEAPVAQRLSEDSKDYIFSSNAQYLFDILNTTYEFVCDFIKFTVMTSYFQAQRRRLHTVGYAFLSPQH